MTLVLVRGIGDVGSAVAHRLFRAGRTVVIHDTASPAYPRRGMAFTDAIFDGTAQLEGVFAKHARTIPSLKAMVECNRAIAVATDDLLELIEAIGPDVLVDARMLKHQPPEKQRELARLTIGLGPSFIAGETTHLVIETAWGHRLGQIIERGPSLPLRGEPKALAGHGRDRFVYTEVAGEFVTDLEIGDDVIQGDTVGRIGAGILSAPLTGRLRGLTHSGVWVNKGSKVIEVDARGTSAVVRGLGERPTRIAEGVVEAIKYLM
jgi:xanthine dehydrogenase accessory factor